MDLTKESTPSREHSIEPVTTHTRNKIVLRANRSTVHKPRNASGGGGGSTRTYNKRTSKKNKLIKTSKTRNKNKEINSTSKEVNESRIIPVEEPPREELPYDKFYPDLKLDEKLVVVYVSSKDLDGDQEEEKEIKEETTTMEEDGEIAAKDENNIVQTQENGDVSEHQPIVVENNMIISTSQVQIEQTETTTAFFNNHHQKNNIQEMLSSMNNAPSIKGSGSSLDSFASLPKNFEEETFTLKDFEDISSSKDLNEEIGVETPSSKFSSPKLLIGKPSFSKDENDDDDTASFKASSHDDMDEETIDEDEQEEMQIDLENNMVKLLENNGDVSANDKEVDWTPTSPMLAIENTKVIENGVKKEDILIAECPSTAIITTLEDNTPTVQPPPVKKLPVPTFKRINFTKEEPDEPFVRPEGHYIRHVELSEKELVEIVEYDMDEQDDYWLKAFNEERRKEDLGELSADVFEAIIDRLEKEWFDLTKNLPKGNADKDSMTPEDSACAICDDGECENSNAIVFCDGCNLAVHQDCYGIPYIPEGQWLCRKCIVSPETPVSCIFCPNEGGAFKKTNTNRWAHLLCALWIPEVGLSNTVYMEPIDNIEGIPRGRWKLKCYICEKKMGACIQCQNTHCCTAFHVTCARKAKLCMRMKFPDEHHSHYIMKAYCDKHTPRDYREQVDVVSTVTAAQKLLMDPVQTGKKRRHDIDYGTDESDDYIPSDSDADDMEDQYIDKTETSHSRKTRKRKQVDDVTCNRKKSLLSAENGQITQSVENKNSKAARAYDHTYTDTAPVAPAIIMDKLLSVLARQKGTMRKKQELIATICKYWSLKRESRRGAPLLKRLHLEPWTASASAHKQSEEEKWAKYMAMTDLRKDLEKVRMLIDLVHRREKEKLKKTKLQVKYLETILFPLDYILRPVLEEIAALDKNEIFAKPVSIEEVPDYLIHIKHPMDFGTMRKKIDAHEYSLGSGMQGFKDDLELVFCNAMTYNTSDTIYYRVARKLQAQSQPIMARTEKDYAGLNIDPEKGVLDVPLHPEIFTYNSDPLKLLEPKKKTIPKRTKKARGNTTENGEGSSRVLRSRTTRSATASLRAQETKVEEYKAKEVSDGKKLPKGWVYLTDDDEEEEEGIQEQVPVNGVEYEIPVVDNDSVIATRTRSRKSSVSETAIKAEEEEAEVPAEYSEVARRSRSNSQIINEATPSELNSEFTVQTRSRKGSVDSSTAEITNIPFGSLVWAKMQGFPWYPAEVADPDKAVITSAIRADKKEGDTYLVHFFDERKFGKKNYNRSWKWVPANKVILMGDEKTDLAKLKDRGMKNNMKREIPNAYEAACKSKGLEPVLLDQLAKPTPLPVRKNSRIK